MSITVQTLYDQTCFVLLEPGGLRLGLFSQAQFLEILGVVLLDFSQRAALYKKIFTTTVNAGIPEFTVPDDVIRPELCFLSGRIIEKVTEADLTQGHFEWRRQWGPLRQWHEDNLAPKRIEVFPKPDFDGVNYPGDPPPIGVYGDFFPGDHNLTIVGPAAPSKLTWSIGDTLDGIPDSFSHYLIYGVLEQVFSAEGETRDEQRALYCRTRWLEGLSLAEAIAIEELLEMDDE